MMNCFVFEGTNNHNFVMTLRPIQCPYHHPIQLPHPVLTDVLLDIGDHPIKRNKPLSLSLFFCSITFWLIFIYFFLNLFQSSMIFSVFSIWIIYFLFCYDVLIVNVNLVLPDTTLSQVLGYVVIDWATWRNKMWLTIFLFMF